MNANDILLWMSAKRTGPWAGYKGTLEEMAAVNEEGGDDAVDSELPIHQRLRFNLERLAHVEFYRPDCPNGWRVVPPTIAITSGAAIGILCGARTDQLLAGVKQQVPEIRLTSQTECPDRLELLGVADIERIAADCGFLIQHDATESVLASFRRLTNGNSGRPVSSRLETMRPLVAFAPRHSSGARQLTCRGSQDILWPVSMASAV